MLAEGPRLGSTPIARPMLARGHPKREALKVDHWKRLPDALDLGCHRWSRRTARRRGHGLVSLLGRGAGRIGHGSDTDARGGQHAASLHAPAASLAIDVYGKSARIVARASREEDPCRFPALEPALTIKDRTGETLVELAQPPVPHEILRPGGRRSVLFRLPTDMAGCREGGPFLAEASLDPFPVRRRLSGSLIDCPSPQERATDQARQAWTAAATRICNRDPNPP
jgi:hypothetical protein